ncbi:class I glutamine amidotransferase-like protein [Triangularia setosa]|uniref:D-lactate dehydratase n=1 Tax=Triangularia setosa TaxID=2587417 RepID=A0AAN6W9K6_9PEZI|nr:class I glutamine amidotransferase-like protein [Podospora setosa]
MSPSILVARRPTSTCLNFPTPTTSSPPPNLTVASPQGGASPLDPSSVDAAKDDEISVEFLHKQSALWEATTPLSKILRREIVKKFWESGKVVSAVCHGPAALVNVKLSNGDYLLKGKKVAGFSNSEEDAVGLSEKMPFFGEDYEKAGQDWGEKVIVDGKLLTGKNPASAKVVEEAIMQAIV